MTSLRGRFLEFVTLFCTRKTLCALVVLSSLMLNEQVSAENLSCSAVFSRNSLDITASVQRSPKTEIDLSLNHMREGLELNEIKAFVSHGQFKRALDLLSDKLAPFSELKSAQVSQLFENEKTLVEAYNLKALLEIEVFKEFYLGYKTAMRAVYLSPKNFESQLLLMISAEKIKRNREALGAADALIENKMHLEEAYFVKGLVLQALNRPSEALSAFKSAALYKSDKNEVQFKIAEAFFAMGKYEDAFSLTEDLASSEVGKNRNEFLDLRANLFIKKKNYQAAMLVANQMISQYPKSVLGYRQKAKLSLQAGRTQEALSQSEQALYFFPEDNMLLLTKVNALIFSGRTDESRLLIEKLDKKARERNNWQLTEMRLEVFSKHYHEALAIGRKLISRGKVSSSLYTLYAQALMNTGRSVEAIPIFDRLLQRQSQNSSKWGNYALALLRAGKKHEALIAIKQAIKLNSEPRFYELKIQILEKIGLIEEAKFERAQLIEQVQKNPNQITKDAKQKNGEDDETIGENDLDDMAFLS